MIIDLFASLFISGMFPGGVAVWVFYAFWILIFGYWIYSVVRLSKNKSKGGMWAILGVGLLISFFFACIASMFISSDKGDTERERERERESKNSNLKLILKLL
ncbi:hypothetical protein [endosymbiont DhMRE of Dentiscutata heterogama]|uniref:hypothetical protein n=1 Tax=endosymbiont DhMRE of Dentiscutata heterogama TaxID=1609546 RepID=UPI0018A81101|nr:hypothetical protein [endosymbiont DhMRE of Dentiscutata heterogama]